MTAYKKQEKIKFPLSTPTCILFILVPYSPYFSQLCAHNPCNESFQWPSFTLSELGEYQASIVPGKLCRFQHGRQHPLIEPLGSKLKRKLIDTAALFTPVLVT